MNRVEKITAPFLEHRALSTESHVHTPAPEQHSTEVQTITPQPTQDDLCPTFDSSTKHKLQLSVQNAEPQQVAIKMQNFP
jgi:hypothetical protein